MSIEKFYSRNHAVILDDDSKASSIRKFLLDKFGIWDIWDLFPYRWSLFYYDKIKPIFKPKNKRLRKCIPRKWKDFSYLLIDLNFEIVKIFYEEEYKAGIVDWQADEIHSKFAEWLEQAYKYITIERPALEKALEKAYPPLKPLEEMFKPIDRNGKKYYELVDDNIPYDIKYAKVIEIESKLDNLDTDLLTNLIKNRDFFWT